MYIDLQLAWCCCYFTYYGLINLKHENRTPKTAMAKRLARERAFSMREAGWQLDADVYLEEQ